MHPVILTMAASDSGGGAGIQADLKTITALGGFGTSVLTALTAQNGAEVRGIQALPEEFVRLQLQTVRDGFAVRAAKTGMLHSAGIMRVLARELAGKDFPLVLDPVSVSQSGFRLLREDAVETLVREMLPLALCLTPNKFEAELLSGRSISGISDLAGAAAALLDKGPQAVLIKGGHFPQAEGQESITDWLALPGRPLLALPHARVETANNHGTGCTLSAAMAVFLGLEHTLEDSVRLAQNYLTRALKAGYAPGLGAGSPDFMLGLSLAGAAPEGALGKLP
jgi:hydroxymethylpyrimidine/phosphomethylpyrimidine kinase